MSNVTSHQKAMTAKYSFLDSLSKSTRTRFIHEISSSSVDEPASTLKSQLSDVSPNKSVHLLLSPPGNCVAGTMLKVLANHVATHRPKKLIYVDSENYISSPTRIATVPQVGDIAEPGNRLGQEESGATQKNLPHCMAKLQDGIVRDKCDESTKASALSVIQKQIHIWSKFFHSVGKVCPVELRHVARSIKPAGPRDNELICYYNPRKQIIRQMELSSAGRSVLVVDSQADSVMQLGSRDHFGLDAQPKTLLAHKRFLQSIDRISEQRRVHLSDSLFVPLIRHLDVKQYVAQLATPGIATGTVLAQIAQSMPSWVTCAEAYLQQARAHVDGPAISQSDADRLLQKCSFLDSNSSNAVNAVVKKLNLDRPNVEMNHYVDQALANISLTHQVYVNVYGGNWIEATPEAFVAACARRDYQENSFKGDLLFPELLESSAESDRSSNDQNMAM